MKLRNTNTTAIALSANHDDAILENLALVNSLARRLRTRLPPCVTIDDLTSAGTLGLIEAVTRFEPSRGLQFRTFAQHRILGAMLDFLRQEDPLSRSERRRVRSAASPSPIFISLDQATSHAWHSLPSDGSNAAFARTAVSEVQRVRGCLSARENRVISLLFECEWPNRRVAAALQVNESRISQIKHRAIAKLRTKLGVGGVA